MPQIEPIILHPVIHFKLCNPLRNGYGFSFFKWIFLVSFGRDGMELKRYFQRNIFYVVSFHRSKTFSFYGERSKSKLFISINRQHWISSRELTLCARDTNIYIYPLQSFYLPISSQTEAIKFSLITRVCLSTVCMPFSVWLFTIYYFQTDIK